jgi:hypothetical protein
MYISKFFCILNEILSRDKNAFYQDPIKETVKEEWLRKSKYWLFYNYKSTHEIHMLRCLKCDKTLLEINLHRLVCSEWNSNECR